MTKATCTAHPDYRSASGRVCSRPVSWTGVASLGDWRRVIAGAATKRQALALAREAASLERGHE